MSRADFLDDAEIFAGHPKTLQWWLTTGDPIVVRETAEAGATTLYVDALKQALAEDDKIRFGELIVVVGTGGAAIGARSIPVDATLGRLERHARGAKAVNAAAYTLRFRADAATDPGGSAANLEKTPTGDSDGLIAVALTAADTTTLGEGMSSYKLDRTNAGNEFNLSYGDIKVGATSPAAVA